MAKGTVIAGMLLLAAGLALGATKALPDTLVVDGEKVLTLRGPDGKALARFIEVSPDGGRFLCGGADGNLVLVDTVAGKAIAPKVTDGTNGEGLRTARPGTEVPGWGAQAPIVPAGQEEERAGQEETRGGAREGAVVTEGMLKEGMEGGREGRGDGGGEVAEGERGGSARRAGCGAGDSERVRGLLAEGAEGVLLGAALARRGLRTGRLHDEAGVGAPAGE